MSNEKSLALYYERVSTLHDEQSESMENQRRLCESYLRRHPEIELAEPIDTFSERLSGKSDERPKYQEMMQRLSKGDIDFVLVKDFKRMNRSQEVSAQLKNFAKKYNFKFILLVTGQVYDINASENRMMYGFESLVNEEVVYRQSEYGRTAHLQKCEAKRLNANNITFGYAWDDGLKDIVIDEWKADIIRNLFELYVFRDYGVKELRKYLAENGLTYSANTVNKWLQETAYIGTFHINKKGSELGVGVGQKTKRFTNPVDEWVAVDRPDLAIVDKEIFDLAQRIRESRQHYFEPSKNGVRQNRFRGTHLFSAKVYCNECGCPYVHGYADRKNTRAIYRDSYTTRAKNPLEPCANQEYKRVYEEDMKAIAVTAINGIIQEQQGSFDLLIKAVEEVIRDNSMQDSMIKSKQKELKMLAKSADKILERFEVASGALLADLNTKYNNTKARMAEIESEIVALGNEVKEAEDVKEQIRTIQQTVSNWKSVDKDSLDRKMIEAFIYKMVVHKDGMLEVMLNSNKTEMFNLSNLSEADAEGNPKVDSSFALSGVTEYRYDMEQYLERVRNMLVLLLRENAEDVQVGVLSFAYEENIGNLRTGKKLHFEIMVNVFVTRKGGLHE